jgi:hypothetical protein
MTEYAGEFGQGGLNAAVDPDALLEDIGLDAAEIDWRKEFVGFDEDDRDRLASLEPTFREHADDLADAFYDHLDTYEESRAVFDRSEKSTEQLKETQAAYLVTLGSGEYGVDYFRNRARIGKLHDLLEMPMSMYLGQYGVYYETILPAIGRQLTASVTDTVLDRLPKPDDGTGSALPADSPSETGVPASGTDDGPAMEADDLRDLVAAEVEDAMDDVLAVLRILNLDMQVVTDTYM